MNLVVTRDGSDEITMFVVTDDIYTQIMKIYNDHIENGKNDPQYLIKIVDNISEILVNNYVEKIFTQIFCEEALNWKYEIKYMLCLPVRRR